ncbi:MAG: acyl--CoA ligase family protein [Thermomicrobiales bacterium]
MVAQFAENVPASIQSANDQKVFRTELTPINLLRRSAAAFPGKIAITHGNQGRSYTYREFAERVNRFASALRAIGLEHGDRVAFLSPNTPAFVEAQFAVHAAGGILVGVNTRLNAREIADILDHSGARFLFVDTEFQHLVSSRDSTELHVVRIDDSGVESDPYEQFLATGTPESIPSWLSDEEETISINYTSGTTGRAKGVMFTHRGGYLQALSHVIETRLGGDSVYLLAAPLFHASGWCFPWAVAAVAGTQLCLRKVDFGTIWELIDRHGVTHFHGSPTVHLGIVSHPSAHSLDWSVTPIVGGAPPSPTLLARMRELNLRPIHIYGMTETYAPATICEWHHDWDLLTAEAQARLLARQGVAYLGCDAVRVVDEVMRDVPRDGQTVGEVVMRGNTVTKGYFRDSEATETAFAGGWLHSGDLAVMHPDGAIELHDRKKDIIISGGENISTIEVEQVIVRHPAVLACAVVAIPDDRWGERPKAFVTLRPATSATEAEIITFCRDHLAHYKCPVAVEFGELPVNSTGKVQKFLLREREWTGYDKRIH